MKIKSLFVFLLFAPVFAQASHVRAGEIYYQVTAPFTIKATIATYTKIVGANPGADKDQLSLNWGDGSSSVATRINGPINGDGFPNGEDIGNNIKRNYYVTTHVYAGVPPAPNNFYLITCADSLRNNNILNISFNLIIKSNNKYPAANKFQCLFVPLLQESVLSEFSLIGESLLLAT